MSYIELVIKIPDNYDLSKIQNGSIASKMILNAVANGTPLPKSHGRLIDADELKKNIQENDAFYIMGFNVRICDIDDAHTIIEADTESMYYPQVDGITPTVVAESEGE